MIDARQKYKQVAKLAVEDGFSHRMERHHAVFLRRAPDRLVVTFDNLKSRDMPPPQYPWGFNFVKALGASHLGIMMANRNDWFRHDDVADLFDRLRDEGFFKQFRDVVFYGSSMGGYGALTYCSASPGACVVAMCPQSTLDMDLVPWETRFVRKRGRGDWKGRYRDGAEGAKTAKKVFVFSDPGFELDQKHVDRLDPANLVHLKCRWSGHNVARMLMMTGMLGEAVVGAISGELTAKKYSEIQRRKRMNISRVRAILENAVERGHYILARNAIDMLKIKQPEWRFPRLRGLIKTALAPAVEIPEGTSFVDLFSGHLDIGSSRKIRPASKDHLAFQETATRAKKTGFSHQMQNHHAVYFKRSNDMLIVTFDNVKSRELPAPRSPFAYRYVESLGASHLSVMMSGLNDWFRHEDVADMFDYLRDNGFFKPFKEVVFYGSSMGGYGALAYCSASPGARVVVSTPQTSLDRALVPWEDRYDNGRARGDWSGRYADGAQEAKTASAIYALYDPYFEPDEAHIERLDTANLVALKCPWMEHRIMPRLNYMGLLKPTINQAILGRLSAQDFRTSFRQHRANPSRTRTVLTRALGRGHSKLVVNALEDLKVSNPDWDLHRLRAKVRKNNKASIS